MHLQSLSGSLHSQTAAIGSPPPQSISRAVQLAPRYQWGAQQRPELHVDRISRVDALYRTRQWSLTSCCTNSIYYNPGRIPHESRTLEREMHSALRERIPKCVQRSLSSPIDLLYSTMCGAFSRNDLNGFWGWMKVWNKKQKWQGDNKSYHCALLLTASSSRCIDSISDVQFEIRLLAHRSYESLAGNGKLFMSWIEAKHMAIASFLRCAFLLFSLSTEKKKSTKSD